MLNKRFAQFTKGYFGGCDVVAAAGLYPAFWIYSQTGSKIIVTRIQAQTAATGEIILTQQFTGDTFTPNAVQYQALSKNMTLPSPFGGEPIEQANPSGIVKRGTVAAKPLQSNMVIRQSRGSYILQDLIDEPLLLSSVHVLQLVDTTAAEQFGVYAEWYEA